MRIYAFGVAALLLTSCATEELSSPYIQRAGGAQQTTIIQSAEEIVTFRIENAEERMWQLNAEVSPDIFSQVVEEGDSKEVCVETGIDEHCWSIKSGAKIDFIIVYNDANHYIRIAAIEPAATFSQAYQDEHRGTIKVLIPEVYEMVNIAIALTDFANTAENDNLVYKDTDYYARMRNYFGPYQEHQFVKILDDRLKENVFTYFRDKMNGYAYIFDDQNNVSPSPVYSRISYPHGGDNTLEPFLEQMRSFANDSQFRSFYTTERNFYQDQIDYFESTLDAREMWRWLSAQFPKNHGYDSVKIILSPLIGSNQSLTWFENNNYRELQPYVNFPYEKRDDLSSKAEAIWRGNILFTEINHGFINPEAEKYQDRIDSIFSHRSIWAENGKSADRYSNPYMLFTEYMNWALISLYHLDQMNPADYQKVAGEPGKALERRGFTRGVAFDAMLTELYRSRGDGLTIADLYPAILDWCEEQIEAAAAPN